MKLKNTSKESTPAASVTDSDLAKLLREIVRFWGDGQADISKYLHRQMRKAQDWCCVLDPFIKVTLFDSGGSEARYTPGLPQGKEGDYAALLRDAWEILEAVLREEYEHFEGDVNMRPVGARARRNNIGGLLAIADKLDEREQGKTENIKTAIPANSKPDMAMFEQEIVNEGKPPPPEKRCAPMKKTEIAARILNKTDTKGLRPRKVATKLERCKIRDEGNGLFSIVFDPAYLSTDEIERLKMTDWPPPLKVK